MMDLKAPKGMFRAIGVDTFEGPTADYLIGDFATLEEAKAAANEHAGDMNPCYCYDSQGNFLYQAGTS